jgi:hypothetical protein
MLSARSDAAGQLLAGLRAAPEGRRRRVLGDPAVRIVLDDAVASARSTSPGTFAGDLDAALRMAAANAGGGPSPPPLAERAAERWRLSRSAWPWVWCAERVDPDPLGDVFQRQFHRYHWGLTLTTPDARGRDVLPLSTRLLGRLCPLLSRSAMSHVHVVAVVEASPSARVTSLTNPRLPGVVFVSPAVLSDPWQAAEALLHEAMHVKFVDLEHTHSLMSERYRGERSPMIRPHWNRAVPGSVNEWPVNRALTVLHVYTSLALFFIAVAGRSHRLTGEYGPLHGLDPAGQARRSLDRAHYLRQQLARCEECLGFAGRLFVRWLGEVLRVLDPEPPPQGAYVHLLLDLYEREAGELGAVVARLGGRRLQDEDGWSRALREAAKREIDGAGAAMSLIAGPGAPAANGGLSRRRDRLEAQEAGGASFRDSVDAFLDVRDAVARTLRRVDAAAYLRPATHGGGTAGEAVREMVEGTGRQLGPLFAANVQGPKAGVSQPAHRP